MGYTDEEILKAKKQMVMAEKKVKAEENVEKELEESILDGPIHIYGEEIEFLEREIPELGVSIYMPKTFFLFEKDIKNLLYPMGKNLSHVFGGEGIHFQLALSKTEHIVPNEGMSKFLPMVIKLVEAIGPKVRMLGQGVIKKDDLNIAIIEFVSRAVDTNVYNVTFYFSLNNQLMMGSVNFPTKYQKRMVKVAKELIDSIKILDQEGV